MATEDGSAAPIYDNPKSPKEKRVAKRGDVKTGKQLLGDDGTDDEYESIGLDPSTVKKGDPEAGDATEHRDAYKAWKKHDDAGGRDRKNGKERDKTDGPTIYDMTPEGRGETWVKKSTPTS